MQLRDIITLMDSNHVIDKAKVLLQRNKYEEVVQCLSPHYNPNAKSHNLEIIHMLAEAYKNLCNNEEMNFSLLKIVRTETKKNLLANPISLTIGTSSGHIFMYTILDMIVCAPTIGISEMLFKEGLDTLEKYPIAFDKKIKKECLFSLYHNIGIATRKFAANHLDADLKKPLLSKAIDYLKESLKYSPNDLITVLYITRAIVELDEHSQRGIDFLLPYQTTFAKNPYYHYALYILYDLKNNKTSSLKHYALYQKISSVSLDLSLITLFDTLLPNNATLLDKAILKYNNNEFDEAKSIATAILEKKPDDIDAMELTAEIETSLQHYSIAFEISAKILQINPESNVALKVKASCLWQTENNEDRKIATIICENLYNKGHHTNSVLRILLKGHGLQGNHEKVIFYGLICMEACPSAAICYMIAMTYFGLHDYDNALHFLKILRKEYEAYESSEVLETLIAAKFFKAESRRSLKDCAIKIARYLSMLGENLPSLGIEYIIKELKKSNISIPSHLSRMEKIPEEKTDDLDNEEYFVPPEIKAIILEAMSKKSFRRDGNLQDLPNEANSDDEFDQELDELKPEDLKSVGKSGMRKAFISKHADLSPKERKKCDTAISTERLLSKKSKNISGSKIVDDKGEKYKIKIMKSKIRVNGRSRFFKDGIPRLQLAPGSSIVRYKYVERNHTKSSKQR